MSSILIKLIWLLDEYGKEKWSPFDEWGLDRNDDIFCKWLSGWYSEIMIISDKFWFIKRLSDNGKIDFWFCGWNNIFGNLTVARDCDYSQYERLIMALSLSDHPVEELALYLNRGDKWNEKN